MLKNDGMNFIENPTVRLNSVYLVG